MYQVEYLDLSGNNLKVLPKDIGRLTQLKYLSLARNKLTSLPEEFGELWRLERLDLSQNDIHDAAGEIGVITRLPNLKVLYVKQNPLSSLEDLANVAVRAVDASHCCKYFNILNLFQFMFYNLSFLIDCSN